MEFIDARRALELLTDVVEGREQYVYEGPADKEFGGTKCVYQDGGQPSCVVGHALVRAGATPDQLIALDDGAIGADHLYEYLPDHVSRGACEVFSKAQGYQDTGYTWGESLRYARDTYEHLVRE